MRKFLLFLLLFYCAAFETTYGFLPNFPIGFDIGFYINNAKSQTPALPIQSSTITIFKKLRWQAHPYLYKRKLSESDVRNIEELIKKLKELQKTHNSEAIKELKLKLQKKVGLYANESSDMKSFRKLTMEIENALKDDELISKKKLHRAIVKKIRELSPRVPLSMVNHATSIFLQYSQRMELLSRRKKASKNLWKIEEKLQEKDLSAKKISKLMKNLIKSEKFYGCKNNRIELQRIDVLRMRVTKALSHAYILEETLKMIKNEDFEKVNNQTVKLMMENLHMIAKNSDNKYFKLNAQELQIELKEKLHQESLAGSAEDIKLFESLSQTLENLIKSDTYDSAKKIVIELENLTPKLPKHNLEIISLLKKFYHYEDIHLQHKEATKILEKIARSLKHANLTETLLQELTEELYKAQKYLKHHHETADHNDSSYHNDIQHHKIELANALASLNVINLAHKIVKMEKEEYVKIHRDPNVKDLLKSLEIIVKENENDIMRKSAERLIIELREKIRTYEQFRGEKAGLKELEGIQVRLLNISSWSELKILNDSINEIVKSVQLINIQKELTDLRQKVFEIEKVYFHNFQTLKEIEEIIHVPANQTEVELFEEKLKILDEIKNSHYKDIKLTSKAKELTELIEANLKDYRVKNKMSIVSDTVNEVKQTWNGSDNKMAISDGMNKLEMLESQLGDINDVEEHHDDDIKEALNLIQTTKKKMPKKVEIKKNAEILYTIVEQFLKQMSRINFEITAIGDELSIIDEYNTNKIDLSPFKSRNDVIKQDYDRILIELNETKDELLKMNLSQHLNASETFGKENVTMSNVIDTMVKLDNLLTDPTTSSLYKATFRDAQEVEHIESVIEQLKKMIVRLKKYVKIPTTKEPNQTSTEIVQLTTTVPILSLITTTEKNAISESTTVLQAANETIASDLVVSQTNTTTTEKPIEMKSLSLTMAIQDDDGD